MPPVRRKVVLLGAPISAWIADALNAEAKKSGAGVAQLVNEALMVWVRTKGYAPSDESSLEDLADPFRERKAKAKVPVAGSPKSMRIADHRLADGWALPSTISTRRGSKLWHFFSQGSRKSACGRWEHVGLRAARPPSAGCVSCRRAVSR